MIDLIEIEIRCGIIPKYNILLIPSKNICYINNKKYEVNEVFLYKVISIIKALENMDIKKKNIDEEEYFIRIINNNKEEKIHGVGNCSSNYKQLIILFEELVYEWDIK